MTLHEARFVKVYRSQKLCRNVPSHNSCGNASGISHSYKGCWSAVCQILNQVQEYQNLAFILWMMPLNHTIALPFNGKQFF